MQGAAGTTIAACFALAAFAVAIVSGLAGGNPATSVLLRAILAMAICYPVGLLIGLTAQHVVEENLEAHREANPVPDALAEPEAGEEAAEPGGADDEEVIVV